MANVLIVDDSILVRRIVCDALHRRLGICCDEAATVKEALAMVMEKHYEAVLLDYILPDGNGLELLRRARPHVAGRVILFSSLAQEGADITIKALEVGATDFILKPDLRYMLEQDFCEELVDKVSALLTHGTSSEMHRVARFKRKAQNDDLIYIETEVDGIIAVASSMGGPQALKRFLARFGFISLPVVVAQHMPPGFTHSLAHHIGQQARLKVVEAVADTDLRPGTVYIVAGGKHGAVERGRLKVFDAPAVNGVKPSADILLYSCAEAYGQHTVAVVLTGMGKDGLEGSRHVKARGGKVLAESEESAAVWGMPGEVVKAGLSDFVENVDILPARVKEVVDSWTSMFS